MNLCTVEMIIREGVGVLFMLVRGFAVEVERSQSYMQYMSI